MHVISRPRRSGGTGVLLSGADCVSHIERVLEIDMRFNIVQLDTSRSKVVTPGSLRNRLRVSYHECSHGNRTNTFVRFAAEKAVKWG